jgi:CubicO group peptidase (beta-lactamase class C family)
MTLALVLQAAFVLQISAASVTPDASRAEPIVQAAMRGPGAVGVSVAVMRGEETTYSKAYGLADLELAVRADEDTLFRIGSVTKQFTAAAVLWLADRGKLSADDPVTDYLPDYPTHGHEITLRHLLTHTSGVPDYTELGPAWERVQAHVLSDAELVALWRDLPLHFAPGEHWRYSNSGYYLLGMVIEVVSGKRYADVLREAFLEPLQLIRTRCDSDAEVIPNRAQGYAFAGGTHWNDRFLSMSQPGAAGVLISTAGDLVRWQRALVTGQVLSPESYLEMTTPFLLNDGRETAYGMGVQLDAVAGEPCVWHGGGIHGFNSVLLHFPRVDLSIAVISNSEGLRAGPLGMELAEALLAKR